MPATSSRTNCPPPIYSRSAAFCTTGAKTKSGNFWPVIYAALPPEGGLLIGERLLQEDRRGPVATQMQSLNMLVCTEGRERTLSEYTNLLERGRLQRSARPSDRDSAWMRFLRQIVRKSKMMRMPRQLFCSLISLALVALSLNAQSQFKSSAADAMPPELGPAIQAVLNPAGTKIMTEQGAPILEIWFRSALPLEAASRGACDAPDDSARCVGGGDARLRSRYGRAWSGARSGRVYIALRCFAGQRRSKTVAPQRDFMLISRAADDQKADTISDMGALMKQSAKVSGTPHAAVYSMWKAGSDFPGFTYENEADWVLQSKIGNVPICTTVVWKE